MWTNNWLSGCIGSTDAFNNGGHSLIDQAYVDGVSVTYIIMEHLANIFGLFASGISETNSHPQYSCQFALAGAS